MKYKVGDKTLLGEIIYVSENSRVPYKIQTLDGYGVGLEEEHIDKIIIKPKRNIDHIIELLEDGKEEQARKFYNELVPLSEGYAVADEIYYFLKPYAEPSKYPKLTPDELKAVKWLVDGGYTAIHVETTNVILHVDEYSFMPYAKELPIINRLFYAKWLTSEPINLKELLDAQEVDK